MSKSILHICLTLMSWACYAQTPHPPDYRNYHARIVEAETSIAFEEYAEALETYQELFAEYDFVFVRDIKIATQLALYLNEEQRALDLLVRGIESGWSLKSIRSNRFLDELRLNEAWDAIKAEYHGINEEYHAGLDQELGRQVGKMFARDQRMALKALIKARSKSRSKYAEKKFAPHSEEQIAEFLSILNENGYPGEMLIGNDFCMSTILSHHNSISTAYNRQDTLYEFLKPRLAQALKVGQMSAFEFALIDEWYRVTKDEKGEPTYGIIREPLQRDLARINELRDSVFIRSVEVHNRLVEVEHKTGMNFYLDGHPWSGDKIRIRE